MRQIETSSGYCVVETADGLDISVNGNFKCELRGASLSQYEVDEDDDTATEFTEEDGETFYIDEYTLESDIEDAIS